MNREIRVSNTNGNSRQRDAVRVYLNDNLVGEVFPPKRNPVKYLLDHPNSAYRLDLIDQLRKNGLTQTEIYAII